MTRHALRMIVIVALLFLTKPTSAQFNPPNPAFDIIERGIVVQTIGNTPTIIYTINVGELKVVSIEAFIVALEHTFAAGAAADVEALFARITGNIGQVGTTTVDLKHTTFNAPQPAFDFNLNQSTKEIELRVTGKAGVTIQWYLDLKARTTR